MKLPEEVMPYKKKAKRIHPPKAKHKHDYQDCIFEYNDVRFDRVYGFVPDIRPVFGSYCVTCGKVSKSTSHIWTESGHTNLGAVFSSYTEEAERQLNPSTRTLRTFWLDNYWKQKYVDIKELNTVQMIGDKLYIDEGT